MNGYISAIAEQFEMRVSSKLMAMHGAFTDLCVKADPAALMSTSITSGGEAKHIEDAADVVIPEWNKFFIASHEGFDITDVASGIASVHPEFTQEFFQMKKSPEGEDAVFVLMMTVPPVNKERHDVLIKSVDACLEAFNASVDYANAAAEVKMAPFLIGASKEDKDAAKELLSTRGDELKKQAADAAAAKKKEIDEAHQKYLEENKDKLSELEEIKQAANPEAATNMKFED